MNPVLCRPVRRLEEWVRIFMALPEIIEIEPLSGPVVARVTVPGSKSLTNRALVLAALGSGEFVLRGALWSEDTQVMVEALRRLGLELRVEPDPGEQANRTIRVRGCGGRVPAGGSRSAPLELYVGNAGTAARFLAALVALGRGWYRLHGTPRMHERPQGALFAALRQLGYRVETPNDRLPALIEGGGPRGGECAVGIGESSQFASALLLCAAAGGWSVHVCGEDPEESPYVAMTLRLRERFPAGGGEFEIEPDASSGSYFWAANDPAWIWPMLDGDPAVLDPSRWPVQVRRWPSPEMQVDARFPGVWQMMLAAGHAGRDHSRWMELEISRARDLGDAIMTAVVLAPLCGVVCRFTDLGRLRLQECERVAALRTELTRCGARVEEVGDTLTVWPSALHGAEIRTYQDHRMAMCFAILGLKVPGIRIHNPACVAKTFPNFFGKLAAPPPEGLGVRIRDARTGAVLAPEQLMVGGADE
ncbi:3-phosphoshikimate 1-carboxyvinyltransferase [Limisphaera ngatamarikiensis]|uniref:3-phosphoshikimate 1-carboxyvinyltransferase n=1 Tax=Limisphaera ngatamarikiensis TaxID=1324935 RepID=A0A6M1S1G4_9BACT|nr:3-phosphoshikimate 1-carboxyvinyltransferase [Limisphaera ngatamarikiensis]NGO39230.1 3-phosphoshikimate 1-carboxyvinyltransferase [Limisphaera ngatamarikiensis]